MTRTTHKWWMMVLFLGSSLTSANPTLVPGVWKNITPSAYTSNNSFSAFAIDPSNPSTIYTSFNNNGGIMKSTDGGANWIALGTSDPNIYDHVTPFIDHTSAMAVDPANPKHLYASHGVNGTNIGFWISTDGGYNWVMPEGFANMGHPSDVTAMAVDLTDFSHLLLGTHACCTSYVYESTNGGTTWNNTEPGFGGGSFGLSILSYPAKQMGNGTSWLAISDAFKRTTDAGKNWSTVSSSGGVHGSAETYYTSNGVLYAGGGYHLNRSTDNGTTWQSITDGVPGTVYYTICGDGTNLYACPEGNPTNYITSPETDGVHWTPYKGGTQKFTRSVLELRFDPANRIMYGGHWEEGLWALKVDGGTNVKNGATAIAGSVKATTGRSIVRVANNRVTIQNDGPAKAVRDNVYNVDGRAIVTTR